MGAEPHANAATGAFAGAPYGASKRVRGVPKLGWNRMRTQPLGPSVELPMGLRNVCAEIDPSNHADAATEAFGGLRMIGATKRVMGVPEWGE